MLKNMNFSEIEACQETLKQFDLRPGQRHLVRMLVDERAKHAPFDVYNATCSIAAAVERGDMSGFTEAQLAIVRNVVMERILRS
jgi:hypothetical protein